VILLPVLLVVLLVESLAAAGLAATASAARLRADRRWAIEAEIALEGVLAEGRVVHGATLAALPASGAVLLPVSAPPPWTATVRAARLGGSDLVRLTAEVEWRPGGGGRFAGRRGTLLVAIVASDTALVIGERPRF
jgi:hypothetical protein